jgi:hypothetical protein
MNMTMYVSYQDCFPDVEEIRHVILKVKNSSAPTEEYVFNERYCADPRCDCQRVRLEVSSVRHESNLAIMYYVFGSTSARTPGGENPYLEPMAHQTALAPALQTLVKGLIERDHAYRERLERHYHQVKQYLAERPDSALQQSLEEDRRVMDALLGLYDDDGDEPEQRRPGEERALSKRKRKMQRQSRKRNR